MSANTPYAARRLMLDAEYGVAAVEKYSKKSLSERCRPALMTAVLAAFAIFGSILLCEATRTTGG